LESTRPWTYLLISARKRAEKYSLLYDLTPQWGELAWKSTNGCCVVTGLPFVPGRQGRGPHPFSPSIDRIDSKLGYLQTNCRFVLMAVNSMKGEGSDEDMFFIAAAMLLNNGFIVARK
jgi:hypothetical protein